MFGIGDEVTCIDMKNVRKYTLRLNGTYTVRKIDRGGRVSLYEIPRLWFGYGRFTKNYTPNELRALKLIEIKIEN